MCKINYLINICNLTKSRFPEMATKKHEIIIIFQQIFIASRFNFWFEINCTKLNLPGGGTFPIDTTLKESENQLHYFSFIGVFFINRKFIFNII